MRKNKNLARILLLFSLLGIFLFHPLLQAHAKTYKCDVCGKRIRGEFIADSERNIYCSKKCAAKAGVAVNAVCAVCGRRVKDGFVSNGKYYCSEKCLQQSFPQCSYCKKHVNGYFMARHNTVCICKECMENSQKCDLCKLPLTQQHLALDDGRLYCKYCMNNNIFSQEQAEMIFESIRQELKQSFGIATGHSIAIHLVSLPEMDQLTGNNGTKELGLFKTEATLSTNLETNETSIVSEEYNIYVLYGLPIHKFYTVTVHELAHDWMTEYVGQPSRQEITEGWAEFLAWRYAKSKNWQLPMLDIEENQDPVYGGGFRYLKPYLEPISNPASIVKILRKLMTQHST